MAHVEGTLAAEHLSIGGLLVRNQTVGLARRVEGAIMESVPFEGVLGLGFRQLSELNIATPFENMLEQGLLPKAVFSIHLARGPAGGGELLLGAIDESHYEGELRFVPLVGGDGNWQIKMDTVMLRKTDDSEANLAEVCQYGRCRAIIDSGTSLISGHFEQVERLNRQLGAQRTASGLYKLPSCNHGQLPNLVFKIGGRELPLAPEDYVLEISENGAGARPASCYSSLKGHHYSQYPFWILGDLFLRTYYTVFDFAGRRLGLARNAD